MNAHVQGDWLVETEEDLVLEAQLMLHDAMEEQGISRAELAERAGISRARVTQLLTPGANPTLRTLARLFYALGQRMHVHRKPLSWTSAASTAHEGEWSAEQGRDMRGAPAYAAVHDLAAMFPRLLPAEWQALEEQRLQVAASAAANDDIGSDVVAAEAA